MASDEFFDINQPEVFPTNFPSEFFYQLATSDNVTVPGCNGSADGRALLTQHGFLFDIGMTIWRVVGGFILAALVAVPIVAVLNTAVRYLVLKRRDAPPDAVVVATKSPG